MLISCHIYTHHILYVKHLQSNYISKLLEYAFVPPSLRERHRLTIYPHHRLKDYPQARLSQPATGLQQDCEQWVEKEEMEREQGNGESLE